MQIPFRQGLVRVPTTPFLRLEPNNKVSLIVGSGDTFVATLSDGPTNYLITQTMPVPNAWNGPFAGGDYWLYLDINTVTGKLSYGHTMHVPIDGDVPPASPAVDQHWFDTNTSTTKVWYGNSWVRKIRMFVAQLAANTFISLSINSPAFTGTQVGITTPAVAGALVFDSTGAPLVKTGGVFFTTEDVAVTGVSSTTPVKFGSIVIEAEAATAIPAYTMVRFVEFGKISSISGAIIDNGAYGIVETSAPHGSMVNVTMEGLVSNQSWDWSSVPVNTLLYADSNGALVTTPSAVPAPVALVIDANTILLRPFTFLIGGASTEAINPVGIDTTDPVYQSITPHINNWGLHLTTAQNTFLDSLVSAPSGGVVVFNNGVGYTRTISSSSLGLSVVNGNGIAGNITINTAGELSGVQSLSTLGLVQRTGTGTYSTVTNGTSNQVLGVAADGSSLEYKAIVAGSGVTVTHGIGTISIASTSSGVTDHTLLTNIGTNTHAQIDTALTRLANTSGTNTGDQTTITGNSGTTTSALGIKTATTTVSVSSATAPTVGQVLTCSVEGSVATWQTPISGGVTDHTLLTNIGTNTHAQIDTALTRLVGTSGTNTGDQTTVTGNSGTTTAALGIKTATTTVSVSSATAPTVGQVLTCSVEGSAATWQTPSGGGTSDHTLLTNIGTNTHAQIDTALTRLANTSGSNTGDQDLTGLVHTNRAALDLVSGTNTGDQTTITGNSGTTTSALGLKTATTTVSISSATAPTLGQVLTCSVDGTVATWQTPAAGGGGVTDHTLLTNIGTNTHAQIDTALTRLANTSGTNTGDQTTVTGNSGTTTAALGIKTATTTVSVSSATAPATGQVLTAVDGSTATWQTPAAGGGGGGATLSAVADLTTYYVGLAPIATGTWTDARTDALDLYYTSGDNTLYATNMNTASDSRVKDNINTIVNATAMVKSMRGVSFNWKVSGNKSYGVVAQEMEQILPELVNTVDDKKSVNYIALIGFLIESVKELNARIEQLESK